MLIEDGDEMAPNRLLILIETSMRREDHGLHKFQASMTICIQRGFLPRLTSCRTLWIPPVEQGQLIQAYQPRS